jgi:hypothetical protein
MQSNGMSLYFLCGLERSGRSLAKRALNNLLKTPDEIYCGERCEKRRDSALRLASMAEFGTNGE